MKGGTSRARTSRRTRSSTISVAITPPLGAFPITRAARLMASPLIEYVRRKVGPKSPPKTPPRFTPARSGRTPARSTTRRATPEDAVLDVPAASGGARDEHQLAAVAVDVALEEGDAVTGTGLLGVAHDGVQRLRPGPPAPRAPAGRRCRRTRRRPPRRCGAPSFPRPPGGGPARAADNSSATSSSPTSTVPADDSPRRADGVGAGGPRRRPPRPGPGGSSAAVAPLSMIWPALASASISAHRLAAGPLMTSSRWICGSPTRKKSNRPLCTPTDMRRLTPPADELGTPDRAQLAAHVGRGADRPDGVVLAGEEEQHGVAAPLHQVAALTAGVREQRPEGGVEDVAELLGAHRPLPGQPPGQRREAGDVDEGEGPLDAAVPLVGVADEPLGRHVGHVGAQRCRHDHSPTVPIQPKTRLETEPVPHALVSRPRGGPWRRGCAERRPYPRAGRSSRRPPGAPRGTSGRPRRPAGAWATMAARHSTSVSYDATSVMPTRSSAGAEQVVHLLDGRGRAGSARLWPMATTSASSRPSRPAVSSSSSCRSPTAPRPSSSARARAAYAVHDLEHRLEPGLVVGQVHARRRPRRC